MTNWTHIQKVTTTPWTDIPKVQAIITQGPGVGSPIGLLMALTYATSGMISIGGTNWTNITKPSGTTWTNIPKA